MLIERHCRLSVAGKTPYTHQADGLATLMERLERFSGAGLLHDMGCGKTLTILTLLLAENEGSGIDSQAKTMFVACPSSVIGAWENECAGINERHGRNVIECLALDHASVAKREAALKRCILERDVRAADGEKLPPLVVATNFEGVWRSGLEATLRLVDFDIKVADESQKIKAPGSKQSMAMHRIGKNGSKNIIMTGTPVPEGGLDWYGQWRFADPSMLGTSYANFKARFALEFEIGGASGKTFRKVSLNPHTKHILEELVMERCHRVSKSDAVDLPPELANPIEFDLSPRQRRIYDDLVRSSLAMIERSGSEYADLDWGEGYASEYGEVLGENVLTCMLRLQQITGGFMQVHGEHAVEPADPRANPKLAALADLAETLRDTGNKLVIFHRFTHEGQAIVKLCERLSGKRPVSIINGAVPARERRGMIEEFQQGDASFFVGQINACAEGITLHAASDTALYSMPFASAVYEQALARVHRIGQTAPVTHHHLLARGTIDESVYETLLRKREAAVDAIDGGWLRYLTGGD